MNRRHAIELDHRNANLSTDGVTTSLHAYTTHDSHPLHVIVADGRHNVDSDDTIIWPASFAAHADPLERTRIAILANQLSARVAFVETPGIATNSSTPVKKPASQSSLRQLLSVASGNFDPLARIQLDALDEALELQDGQEVRFIGYSMGAWATASMAKLLARHHFTDKQLIIPRIDLIEAVNDQKYNLSDLLRKIRQEDQYNARYLTDENAENGLVETLNSTAGLAAGAPTVAALKYHQGLMPKALSLGIRNGFANSLLQAVGESTYTTRLTEGSINLWRAHESLVARQEANEHTLSQLGRVATRMVEIHTTAIDTAKGHHHSFVHSMGNIANLAAYLHRDFPAAP